jgi:uncharacterized phage protein (TIGR01671 family)
MIREIKFRKWGRHTNGELDMVDWTILNASNGVDFRVDEGEVFMQYTGINDQNGKEIYEGDVIGWNFDGKDESGVVEWQGSGFWVSTGQGRWMPSTCVVIGNIYENPNLLKDA